MINIYDAKERIIIQTRMGKSYYWSDNPVTFTVKCIGLRLHIFTIYVGKVEFVVVVSPVPLCIFAANVLY